MIFAFIGVKLPMHEKSRPPNLNYDERHIQDSTVNNIHPFFYRASILDRKEIGYHNFH